MCNPDPRTEGWKKNSKPRIYVACLAAYNNGYHHGAWIDADQDAEEIQDEMKRMLSRSPISNAEEWAIHDHEGFEGATVSEYMGFAQVTELAAFVIEHGQLGAEVLAHFGGSLEEARDALEGSYLGCFESLADYVQSMTEECEAIPTRLAFYIDWDAMARDAEMGGDLFTIQTAHDEVHVFSAC